MDENERLAKLESAHDGLHDDVQSLANSLRLLGKDFRSSIDSLQKQISEMNRTPWPTVLQGGVLIIALMGFIGSFYVRDLERLEAKLEGQGIALLKYVEKGPTEKEIRYREEINELRFQMLEDRINRMEP